MPEPDDTDTNSATSRRGFVRNTSVATRLSLVVVLVALVSLVITSLVGLSRGGALAQELLRDRLTAIGAARADEVERYLRNLERITLVQASSPSTADAIREFSEAYAELDAGPASADDVQAVDEFYLDVVAPELSEVRGRPVTAASLVPQRPAGVHLQANYVVRGDDEARLIEDADDGSRWSEVHQRLHRAFSEIVVQSGADDLYLIEPAGDTIVYSTSKALDFATSLRTGPQSGGALATLIGSFGSSPSEGDVRTHDFTSYTSALGVPSAFVASPVVIDGTLAGFVALRFGPSALSAITTDDGVWAGQGETGETYLVARDNLMRSDARPFLEDQDTYLENVASIDAASDDQIRLMERFGTTVLFQPIADDAVDAAIDDPAELVEATSYLDVDVLQARRPIAADGLEWAIIAEIDRDEVERPLADFARNLLIAIALFLVGITFLATRWAHRLLGPIRLISTKLRTVRAGGATEEESDTTSLPDGSATEFVELADDIDTMLATLADRQRAAHSRADEHRQLLRRLLPPQAVQRAEAGERDVIDQVAHATIAVIVIHGMGHILRDGSIDRARSLLDQIVDEADALARQRGLERIRLTGDSYVAGCGTVRPHIDHAARTLAFVLDVRALIGELADDAGQGIDTSVGVDSGPVTVGLTGGTGLVYDAWGETVQHAADLARRAGRGEVLVSSATRSQLPTTFEISQEDPASGVYVVSGRNNEAGVT